MSKNYEPDLERVTVIPPTTIKCCRRILRKVAEGETDIVIQCGKCCSWYHIIAVKPKKCPECGNTDANGEAHPGCDWVYGRRGWRQLGVYDG